MAHCGAGDGSRMRGGPRALARATERNGRYWDQPFGIWIKKTTQSLDLDTDGERPGGWLPDGSKQRCWRRCYCHWRQEKRWKHNEHCHCLGLTRRAARRERETGTNVELAESHSVAQHHPHRRFQRPQQTMGPKMPSAAECCILGRRDWPEWTGD